MRSGTAKDSTGISNSIKLLSRGTSREFSTISTPRSSTLTRTHTGTGFTSNLIMTGTILTVTTSGANPLAQAAPTPLTTGTMTTTTTTTAAGQTQSLRVSGPRPTPALRTTTAPGTAMRARRPKTTSLSTTLMNTTDLTASATGTPPSRKKLRLKALKSENDSLSAYHPDNLFLYYSFI
jgi:hypothetical protein